MRLTIIPLTAILLVKTWSASEGNGLEHQAEPQFTGPVVFDRTEIELGETFTLTATLTNTNPLSSGFGGRIVVSFPDLAEPGDPVQVADAGSSSGDLAGYTETAAGSSIRVFDECSEIVAEYLVVEYVDQNWTGLESNTISLVVTPPRAGSFLLGVRGQMHLSGAYPGCPYLGMAALPSNGSEEFEDQQGAPVRRFEVVVKSPVPVLPLTWGSLKSRYGS